MMIPVCKYHGCGNDFIMTHYDNVKDLDLTDFIIKACDRHTGIGADGAIFIKEHPLTMIYYNQDGSRAPMCGNGIRCFAKYCFDEGICTDPVFTVETLAGTKTINRLSEEPFLVNVEMGNAQYELEKIGVDPQEGSMMHRPLTLQNGEMIHIYSFFMSTVHTVVFVKDAFASNNEAIGKEICHHPLFSEQTNVNFVEIVDHSHLRVQTYERGCGMTLACGTGVCASALMAYKEKGCDSHLSVELCKGSLSIDIDEHEAVKMSGPAQRIMKGDFNYD